MQAELVLSRFGPPGLAGWVTVMDHMLACQDVDTDWAIVIEESWGLAGHWTIQD